MIAIDTSALMAIVLGEADSEACSAALTGEEDLVISAATIAEALIVAEHRAVVVEMHRLIDGLGLEIASVTAAVAHRVAEAYKLWGKGHHKAGLNFGDCFAYVTATERNCALLYVGEDFAKTDVVRAQWLRFQTTEANEVLGSNGWELNAEPVEAIRAVVVLTGGEIGEGEFAAWLRLHIKRI